LKIRVKYLKNNIKYPKRFSWLKDFVESTDDLVPLYKLKRINAYKVKVGKNSLVYGSLTKRDGVFNINLNMWDMNPSTKRHCLARLSIVLETLAHELAHMIHWEHDYKHFKLTALILLRFSAIIKKMKIKDISARIK